MSATLHLTITTLSAVLVDNASVCSVRAEDESGSFGILPGHTDLITALPASVVRWRNGEGVTHFCALRGGVLTVSEGRRVAIACRQGTLGDDLAALEQTVEAMRTAELDTGRQARVEQTRLHARAVRQLVRYLRPEPAGMPEAPAAEEDVR